MAAGVSVGCCTDDRVEDEVAVMGGTRPAARAAMWADRPERLVAADRLAADDKLPKLAREVVPLDGAAAAGADADAVGSSRELPAAAAAAWRLGCASVVEGEKVTEEGAAGGHAGWVREGARGWGRERVVPVELRASRGGPPANRAATSGGRMPGATE